MGARNPRNYPDIREPDDGEDASEMVVDISSPGLPVSFDGESILELDKGDIEVDLTPGGDDVPRVPAEAEFGDNLAEFLSETELGRIGQDVCEAVRVDLESRRQWLERFRKGMEILGVVEPSANLGVLRHAKEINHPLIAKAVVQ